MSEYCEYMWDPTRGHGSAELARSIYQEEARLEAKDKKLAIKTVRAILREMPGVDLKPCNDEYITRFLLARKYRTEQAAALIGAYQAQIAHRQDIFGNLTARDPALQRALRAGIPGVLPARDRKGRCVLVMLASQWDPIAVPALAVQRAIFLVLETLIQDPRNQQCGFVIVVDWCNFTLRQGSALGAAALRNLIAALRGRFPARFKGIHFLSAPLYVQATLALVKPFLDEKTRHKIYLHGNNLSTLHEHLPTDILPAELGGTGPSFNPGLWAEPVIHSAMKEAELAALKKDPAAGEIKESINERQNEETITESTIKGDSKSDRLEMSLASVHKSSIIDDENNKNVENVRGNSRRQTNEIKIHGETTLDNSRVRIYRDEYLPRGKSESDIECLDPPSETNSNEFEMISSHLESEDSRDNSLDSLRADRARGSKEKLPEETNLIT
ncbi:clavesin-2-like [Fopius arisanus]|uniref:Clavesin-2-like n=1 Tax=Fopius arisanus TaxID=64838 RepID=A0A9R1T744_9HYME|nr:PREDICTED: clavesin-2-like [Fopius arisanus]XP_011304579.1 PREDICTED: clavesin-2-like [Fopius arisanus]